jgi:septal ring factor EnvC (AmiA/AmiB activator)
MRPFASLLILGLLLLAGGAPAQDLGEPLDAALRRARTEQASAEAEAAKLEQVASSARGDAARLRAEQAAAGQAIEAAEARITAADMQFRLLSASLETRRQRLAQEQQPVASLLAGLAVMAQRPPLLALADRGGTDEFVKVRVLLDATLPTIRQRTSALSAQVKQGEQLEQAASAARAELIGSRRELMARRQRFATLEQKALQTALASGGQALTVGDVALAAGENVEALGRSEANSRGVRAIAAALASEQAAPARPVAPEGPVPMIPFAYQLPAGAPVVDGLGSVNESGVRSRGLTLQTVRGVEVAAPAAGIVRFSGAFRDYDGVVIIDHGGGWMTLLLNVSSSLRPGVRVALGQPLGRSLGPLGVELSQNGRRISPALIAGSSQTLSKDGKGG